MSYLKLYILVKDIILVLYNQYLHDNADPQTFFYFVRVVCQIADFFHFWNRMMVYWIKRFTETKYDATNSSF